MQIIIEAGQPNRTDNVNESNANTLAADQWGPFSDEATILVEYCEECENFDCDPIAFKWNDPTEDTQFLFDEDEVTQVERVDPSLIERLEIVRV